MDAHLKAIWLDQVSELKPGALNKNFLRYASSNTNMKQKKLGKDLAAKFTSIYIYELLNVLRSLLQSNSAKKIWHLVPKVNHNLSTG